MQSKATLTYSMVKIARLNGAFSEIFELEASPVEGQSLSKKIRKGEKGKAKKKNEKPATFSKFDFCACQRKNVVKTRC